MELEGVLGWLLVEEVFKPTGVEDMELNLKAAAADDVCLNGVEFKLMELKFEVSL